MEFSLGLVEVSSLGNAIMMLDDMLKAADVEFVAVERKLGGRLVTIVVRGSISSVTASVEAGKAFAQKAGCLKAAEVIARPHPEILKFIHLDKEHEIEPNTQSAATHTGSIGSAAKRDVSSDTTKSRAASKISKSTASEEKSETPSAKKETEKKDVKTAGKTAEKKTKSQAGKASDIKPKKGRKTNS